MRLFSDDSTLITDPHLRRAYRLALRGLGTTSPNPMVGCVIVSGGTVVGEGWHERAGGPHAEIAALEHAGGASAGSTVYVTLEPCAHHGRTPPCTDALIAAGVARVVVGTADPTDGASGGADRLREAGIEVVFAEEASPFESLNEGWLSLANRKRPYVTAKVACSLDAKVSSSPTVRTRISSESSRPVTMRLRTISDAVMVGAHTALVDDPALTARADDGADIDRQPLRVVLMRSTDPSSASLFGDGRAEAVLLAPETFAPANDSGIREVWRYHPGDGLSGALRTLGARGVGRLLVEPGPRLFTALLDDGLVDEIVVIHAGGMGGREWTDLYGSEGSSSAHALELTMRAVEASVVGDDAVTVWRTRRAV